MSKPGSKLTSIKMFVIRYLYIQSKVNRLDDDSYWKGISLLNKRN